MAKDKRDVIITKTNGEKITREGLDADVADAYEDLPFTAPDVLIVETKPSKKGR